MSQRLEEFLHALPGKGVPENAVQLYRTVLEEFEAFLGKAAQLNFSRYEINRFVAQRQRAGASEREVKNINTACSAYLSYCEAQAPAPPVGTAGEVEERPTQLPTPPPPQERRKVLLIVAGCGVLLLGLIGGCLVDKARQSSNERAFSDQLRRLGESTRNLDRQALRDSVEAAAKQHGVRITNLALGLSALSQENLNKLPMDQRMRAMAVLQAQAQPRLTALPGADGAAPRPRPTDETLYYVEFNIVGEVKGLLGSSKLDLELRVLGGGGAQPLPTPAR